MAHFIQFPLGDLLLTHGDLSSIYTTQGSWPRGKPPREEGGRSEGRPEWRLMAQPGAWACQRWPIRGALLDPKWKTRESGRPWQMACWSRVRAAVWHRQGEHRQRRHLGVEEGPLRTRSSEQWAVGSSEQAALWRCLTRHQGHWGTGVCQEESPCCVVLEKNQVVQLSFPTRSSCRRSCRSFYHRWSDCGIL